MVSFCVGKRSELDDSNRIHETCSYRAWKTERGLIVEFNKPHWYVIAGQGKSAIANRLDNFTADYQETLLQELAARE